MPLTDVERLATLEAEMKAVQADLIEIKHGIKSLAEIAQNGRGAFNAILMLGGLVG